ncbi:MAG: hypothetical protein ACR2QS_05310 [Woeseiaceae bacterium]
MFNKTNLATLAAIVAIIVITAPPVHRTMHMASSADGLLLLASFADDDFSLNPWSEDCYLVRQDMAVAILKRFGWPYRHRGSAYWPYELPPLIYQAIGARGVVSNESDIRLLDLISVFIDRKRPINKPWDGYMPIHLAILSGDIEVVELLLEHDVDLDATISNPGRAHHGMDSFEFAELLLKESSPAREQIYEALKTARSK